MTFMNDFVEEEWSNMKDFLHKISVSQSSVNASILIYSLYFFFTLCVCVWRVCVWTIFFT